MAEINTGKNTGRENLKPPWKPGQSGNPKGRRSGSVSITSSLKRALKETHEVKKDGTVTKRKMVDIFSRALIQLAMRGNTTALKEILDRIDGPVGREAPPDSGGGVEAFVEALAASAADVWEETEDECESP